MVQLAANLSMMYPEHDFPRRFAAAAADGFRGVEFLFPYAWPAAQLRAWLDQAGLAQILFNAPPGDWAAGERGLAGLPGREAEFRDGLLRALDYAALLGNRLLHVMAGIVPEGMSRTACLDRYRDNLAWAAAQAATAGVTLTIEPINGRDMPGYLLQHQRDAHDVVQAIGAPNLGVQFDLYHGQIVEGDLTTKLRAFLPGGRVAHLQIAGVPQRHEPDSGELDIHFLLAEIDALGYGGWVGCEYRPAGATSAGLGWARRYL